MAAYWGLFSIFALGALFGHGEDTNRRAGILLVLSMVLLALFVGLRWEIGPDWPTYRSLFQFLHDTSLSEVAGKSDPGFRALVMVLQWEHAPFWVLNLICACIFSFGLARFCTTLPNPWLAVLVAVPYIVVADDLVSVGKEGVGEVAAQETRDAGDEDTLLRHGPLWSDVEEIRSESEKA